MWFKVSWGWGRPVTFFMLGRHFNDLLLRTGHPNFFYGCAPKAVMFAPLLKRASAHWFATTSKIPSSLWQDQGMTHSSSWSTTYSSSQLRGHLLLQNPSPWEEFPLPPPQGGHGSSAGIPTPVGSQCQFWSPFAGLAIVHVKAHDRSHPSSSIHHPSKPCSGSAEHMYKHIQCFRCHTHLLSIKANTSFNTELPQIILLSLQKSCKVLCLLPKLLCIWMFWFQYYSAHGFSCFENRKFTSPTGSPLVLKVCSLLLSLDTTPIDVIKKFPRVKATGMGVLIARYFKIVSVNHAVDFCFFLKIFLNRQWACHWIND